AGRRRRRRQGRRGATAQAAHPAGRGDGSLRGLAGAARAAHAASPDGAAVRHRGPGGGGSGRDAGRTASALSRALRSCGRRGGGRAPVWTELQIEVAAEAADLRAGVGAELTGGVGVRGAGTLERAAAGRALIVAHCPPDDADAVVEAIGEACRRATEGGF